MKSSILNFCLALAVASIAVYHGNAFTTQLPSTNCRTTSSALFGKRAKAKKIVKKIFRVSDDKPIEVVEDVQSNFPADGQKVKLSNGRAKDLAKKYRNIECLEERTYQVLVDLKMV